MLAELRRVFADFRRPDQELERATEPAALSGDDLVGTRFCAGFISLTAISR
jgi:hypothetical protein